MMRKSNYIRLAGYQILEQLQWSLWFLGIMIALYIAAVVFSQQIDFDISNFLVFSYSSLPGYTFVAAIIAGAYFFPFYVKNGVTRKDYYRGSVLANCGLSACYTAVVLVISVISEVILKSLDIEIVEVNVLANINNYWLPNILSYFINAFVFYLFGWFIYIGFYRFGVKVGLGFILISIPLASFIGLLWSEEIGFTGIFTDSLEGFQTDNQLILAFAGTIGIAALLLVLIRIITKRAPIKL